MVTLRAVFKFRKLLQRTIKNILKRLIKLSPIALTQGERIDRTTAVIIRQVLDTDSNCVDVGAHKGEILDMMRAAAPQGHHYAFEPLPHLYETLLKRYTDPKLHIFPNALSDKAGQSTFQYVRSNPAYSGILQREYDRPNEQIEEITVELRRLDDCIDENTPIHFMKIDVEGAELLTLKGASRILAKNKPFILLEHGRKGSAIYGYDAGDLYDFLTEKGYQLYTLDGYCHKQAALSRDKIMDHYEKEDEFYFVAK